MKNHPHASLFNENLDKTSPIYEEIKGDFKVLRVINLNTSIDGHYKMTDEIAKDYREIIRNKIRLASVKEDSQEEMGKIEEFHSDFEKEFAELGLEGLSLIK